MSWLLLVALLGWITALGLWALLHLTTHCAHCRAELAALPVCHDCGGNAGPDDDGDDDGEPHPEVDRTLRVVDGGREAA